MKPAVRLGNNHECPSTAHGPHVGGPVTSLGCDSVLIEFLASARGGDIALCKVELDVIVKGSDSVWIGGMPAARLHEACLHGGRVVQGARDVFIGGAAIDPPNIDKIIKNVEEINELRRKLEKQAKEVKALEDEYIKPNKSPLREEADKLMDKWTKPKGGLAAEPDDSYNEERAREIAMEMRRKLQKKMAEEQERIRELERQNREMQRGKPPQPGRSPGPGGVV